MGSSIREIQARIDKLKAVERSLGRGLLEAEFNATFGRPVRQRQSRRGVIKTRPKCTDRVLAAAHLMHDDEGRVKTTDLAHKVGVSTATVSLAVAMLREEGRWPYRYSRNNPKKQGANAC
jgi:hypothetical protein